MYCMKVDSIKIIYLKVFKKIEKLQTFLLQVSAVFLFIFGRGMQTHNLLIQKRRKRQHA